LKEVGDGDFGVESGQLWVSLAQVKIGILMEVSWREFYGAHFALPE